MLNSNDVNNWLFKNFDLCFVSETHLTKGQIFEVSRFRVIHNPDSLITDKKAHGVEFHV